MDGKLKVHPVSNDGSRSKPILVKPCNVKFPALCPGCFTGICGCNGCFGCGYGLASVAGMEGDSCKKKSRRGASRRRKGTDNLFSSGALSSSAGVDIAFPSDASVTLGSMGPTSSSNSEEEGFGET